MSFLTLFKIFRVSKIAKMIDRSILPKKAKTALNLLKLSLYLMLFIHIQGCIWYYCITINGEIPEGWSLGETVQDPFYQRVIVNEDGERRDYNPWYPPLDWIDFTKSHVFHPDERSNFLDRYFLCCYYSILFIG